MNQFESAILRGNIEKVYYAGPKFSVGRLRSTSKSHSFAANLFATEGLAHHKFTTMIKKLDNNAPHIQQEIHPGKAPGKCSCAVSAPAGVAS